MAKSKVNTTPFILKIMRLIFKILTPFMPNTMGSFAYKLWFTPTRTKVPEQEEIVAKKAKVSFLMVEDLKIRVWSWGEGPTVLFIHGWGGRGTQISSFIENLNNAGFNVMSFDFPAHGQSDGKTTNAFAITKTIGEVIKKIDNLHSVITHSFGGIIFGYYYNLQLKIKIKNIVLICPPSTIHTALNQFSETLKLPKSVQLYIEDNLKKDFGEDVFEKLSLEMNSKKITQPVLIVHDKDDDVVPFEDGKVVMNALQSSSFYETNALGHRKILFDQSVVGHISTFICEN